MRVFRLATVLWLLTTAAVAADLDAGVKAYERGDYASAYREWQPLAEAGDPLAQYNLALLYQFGLGMAPDRVEAARWYSLSAEQGFADAQVAVGDLYLDGFWGFPDSNKAAVWYRLAAAQGHAEARRKLSALQGPEPARPEPEDTPSFDPEPDKSTGMTPTPGGCPTYPGREFTVAVQIEIPPAPINHELSSAELTQGTFHGRGNVLGLMVPDLDIRTRGNYTAIPHGDGFCFWTDHIDVVLEYHSIDIYVASEYDERSCPYREVLKHEQEHVRIARQNLERYAPKVRYALTSLLIPKPNAPKRVQSKAAAKQEMEALYEKLLRPVYEEMLEALIKAQGAIDTPEAYRRVRMRCRNW